jgi:hypothetical protein
LIKALAVDDDASHVAAELVNSGAGAERNKAALEDWWSNVTTLLNIAPAELGSFRPVYYTFEDADFDVQIAFRSKSNLITSPTNFPLIVAREPSGWRASTSTGIAFTRLTDDEFTVRTVPGSAGGDAKRVAIKESSDVIDPEAAFFIHLAPNQRGLFGRFQLTVGLGLDTAAATRTYGGISYRFGNAGTILVGAAGGRVKRLSESIDPNDLGDNDPNATRRDVFDIAPMFGLSWRFGQQ